MTGSWRCFPKINQSTFAEDRGTFNESSELRSTKRIISYIPDYSSRGTNKRCVEDLFPIDIQRDYLQETKASSDSDSIMSYHDMSESASCYEQCNESQSDACNQLTVWNDDWDLIPENSNAKYIDQESKESNGIIPDSSEQQYANLSRNCIDESKRVENFITESGLRENRDSSKAKQPHALSPRSKIQDWMPNELPYSAHDLKKVDCMGVRDEIYSFLNLESKTRCRLHVPTGSCDQCNVGIKYTNEDLAASSFVARSNDNQYSMNKTSLLCSTSQSIWQDAERKIRVADPTKSYFEMHKNDTDNLRHDFSNHTKRSKENIQDKLSLQSFFVDTCTYDVGVTDQYFKQRSFYKSCLSDSCNHSALMCRMRDDKNEAYARISGKTNLTECPFKVTRDENEEAMSIQSENTIPDIMRVSLESHNEDGEKEQLKLSHSSTTHVLNYEPFCNHQSSNYSGNTTQIRGTDALHVVRTVTSSLPHQDSQLDSRVISQNDKISQIECFNPGENPGFMDLLSTEIKTQALVGESTSLAFDNMKPCVITAHDKYGKSKSRPDNYVGLCCKYCNGYVGSCRFFPISLNSFVNGRNAQDIKKHILEDCPSCPNDLKDKLRHHTNEEAINGGKYQPKKFFTYIWKKMRSINCNDRLVEYLQSESNATMQKLDKGIANSVVNWDRMLKDTNIIDAECLPWAPKKVVAVVAQFKLCFVTEDDISGTCKNPIDFPGLCCKHCEGSSGSKRYGRYFPRTKRSCDQLFRSQAEEHLLNKCVKIPNDVKNDLIYLIEEEKRSKIEEEKRSKRNYGARDRIMKNIWDLLLQRRGIDDYDLSESDDNREENKIDWESMLYGSEIITLTDQRDVVPDKELVVMAQIKPCTLTSEDKKKGHWKGNTIGDAGFCCRHCGDNRKFHTEKKNFMQTTALQSIEDHVAEHCKKCPKKVRDTIIKLQKNRIRSVNKTPKNGWRQRFYTMVWKRLGKKEPRIAN